MKMRKTLPLLVLSGALLSLVGCGASQDNGLTLALNSKAYIAGTSPSSGVAMETYHSSKDGDVPYVKLSQYCDALGSNHNFNPYSVTHKDGVYSVFRIQGEEETSPKQEMFRFTPASNSVTYLPGSKIQYRIFDSYDTYADGMGDHTVPNKEKTTRTRLWESRTIDFGKYDLKIYEQNGEVIAPFGLLQAVFSERAAPDGPKAMIFNGRDYYATSVMLGNAASCLSSSLYFRLTDSDMLDIAMSITDAEVPHVFDFSPVTAGQGEKYRFETGKVVTPEFTPPGAQQKSKAIPDFKIRLTLDAKGEGKYTFINATTDQPFEIDALSIKTRNVKYLEDEEALNLGILASKEGKKDAMLRIHKKDTFYRKGERSKEYATYDYNLTRLHFGEYYGLHSRKLTFDTLIAPYKDKICSTSYADYNEGMSRFLLETVDDGHTSVVGYSMFGDKILDKAESAKVKGYNGYRKKGLLDLQKTLKAYRAAAGVPAGLQVVGDTAYLAFDQFDAGAGNVTTYTETPNTYLDSNTIAFVYTAMKEVATNHKEVKRIVYDLTANGGGNVAALPFILATMTDDPALPTYNYYSGEFVDAHYQVDLNGDGKFGTPEDTYKGKYQFFILTSPMSFSCGNALPSFAKINKYATIIGQRSGGGGSIVDQVVTVSGFEFNSSSLISFPAKDETGNYIENDAGIPVDYPIEINSFYNRTLINSTLDQLKK